MNRTSSLRKRARSLLHSQRGATAIEYGLILALIALGAFAAINGAGEQTIGMWDRMGNRVADAM